MEIRTAMIYSSIDGQTVKICQKITELLEKSDHGVEMFSIKNPPRDLSPFRKIVIASSIRYGKHNTQIIKFIDNNIKTLERKTSVFFSVNLVARKPGKDTPETNPYVVKFLNKTTWSPSLVGVFAGKLDYQRYSFFDSLMIRLIMMITKGPVNSKEEIEFTDWKKVDKFGKQIAELPLEP